MNFDPAHIPSATYRLQFNAQFRFDDARQIIDYLAGLGVSDAYASPLFRARENSSHGYDVVDHATIDPAIGTEDDFRAFAEGLRARGLSLVKDVVPNHMGIDDPHNVWWQDVLENGQNSVYAKYFDIDWSPPKEALRGKVLLPFLGDQYGKVLENQELRLVYEDQRFRIAYYDRRFPVAPRTWRSILQWVLQYVAPSLPEDNPDRMELESIITALENLPGPRELDLERIQQRYREKEVVRRRLAALDEHCVLVHEAVTGVIAEYNGRPADPRSFDRLEALLAEQPYRLCYWRAATDEINYRRFFDINALAAIRVEDPDVFQAVHARVFRFLGEGWARGLRIDHPDGLLDPQAYFENLQDGLHQRDGGPWLYVVVEKILGPDEGLPAAWPVCGTTGYEFLNLLSGVLVDPQGLMALRQIYARFSGQTPSFADVLYDSKRLVLGSSMSSELYVLAGQLERIAEQHRWSRDFTRPSLYRALREMIACFPVYRTYLRPGIEEASQEDRRRILAAVRASKRRNPGLSPSFFDFIASVLLLQHPDGISDEDRGQREQFVLKFQQITGPVMAKGLEDTAFYRWYPLASLNEVGGDPASTGVTVEQFHQRTQQRAAAWPYSMLATATHDTKRGEDVRARLHVLSEVPDEWEQAIGRWQQWNAPYRADIDGQAAPDANEEYLLYQTLVGTWPLERLDSPDRQTYVERINAYVDKALKEAKRHTTWINPDPEYDQAAAGFVSAILDEEKSGRFLEDLGAFTRSIADAGWVNSLTQCVLKIGSPGVCDFYQGTELWDFHLVDPDNRQPVDFARRKELLAELQARAEKDLPGLAAELAACRSDPRIKLLVVWRSLEFRRRLPDLFLRGQYLPLAAEGPRAQHACAFARRWEDHWAVVVVPRLAAQLWRSPQPSPAEWWQGTSLRLPAEAPRQWRHVVTGTSWLTREHPDGESLDLAELFAAFPVCMLSGESTIG